MRSLLLALVLAAPLSAPAAYEGPIFDAHLHYNVEAVERYPVGTVMELFSKNGVKAILANSRPNDGTRALVEARTRPHSTIPAALNLPAVKKSSLRLRPAVGRRRGLWPRARAW